MLYIYIDDGQQELPNGYVSRVSNFFDNDFEPEWFQDEFVRRILKEIDNSVVAGEGLGVNIYNETLGNIPPQNLSSGCKALILLYEYGEDIKINGDRLGDNCIGLLLEIAETKDITISLGHIPPFPEKFHAVIVNNGKRISKRKEFTSEYIDLG